MTNPDSHVTNQIGGFVEGELPADDAERVRVHLAQCLDCRRAYDALRMGLDTIRDLRVYEPPASVWQGIERALDRPDMPTATPPPWWSRRVATAAAVASLAGIAATYLFGVYRSSWSIERLAGTPVVGARTVLRTGRLAEGEWLETDGSSRARLSIGTLGSAEVGPGSRVKLVQAGGTARALRVERGSIDARVWAPPRFFLVETPAATAVDLGCVYSLDVDDRGNGTLLVRSGQVELQGHGRVSLVVAGTAAQMRSGAGPGTPYSAGESAAFRDALGVIDFGGDGRTDAFERLLNAATTTSTITLWHLLSRVDGRERDRVYERLSALAPPPRGVSRAGVQSLDARVLDRWRDALEPTWSTERVRLWKRAWRAVWSSVRSR
jgi:anti-sigma factor RsiW